MSGGRDERGAAGTEGTRNPSMAMFRNSDIAMGGLAIGQSPRPSGLEAFPPRGQSRHKCPPPRRVDQVETVQSSNPRGRAKRTRISTECNNESPGRFA